MSPLVLKARTAPVRKSRTRYFEIGVAEHPQKALLKAPARSILPFGLGASGRGLRSLQKFKADFPLFDAVGASLLQP